jgi:hypothetical protein
MSFFPTLQPFTVTTSITRGGAIQRFKSSYQSDVVQDSLNFEELSNHTWPALIPTDATLLDILSVVGGDDVLARLRVVHDRLSVREEAIEGPVEDTSGDEGVDVADVETVKLSCQHASTKLALFSPAPRCSRAGHLQGKEMEETHRCSPPKETLVF